MDRDDDASRGIRDREHSEARLHASQARLARLLATIPAGVVELDATGRITYANPAAERALGAGPNALIGRRYDDPVWRALDRDSPPVSPASLALQGETVRDHEYSVARLDGRRLVLLVDAVPVRDSAGRIEGALAAFQDVTSRHTQAQALRESEARFRHMADSVPALIWMTDPAGSVIFANLHFDYVFGRSGHEFHGDGWSTLIVPDDLPRFRESYVQAARTGRSLRDEVRVVDKAGVVRWFRCEIVPRTDDVGVFLGYTGCAVDITEARLAAEELEARIATRTAELMAAEEQLRQAQKMEAVGQLTGGIAHDFNNMLQAISSNLELLRRRTAQGRPKEAETYATSAQRMVDRAAALTLRLLAFSRRQQLQPEAVLPDQLIEGMTELIRRSVGPQVAIELQLGADRHPIVCDASQLENALLNLAINARDAMPAGGRLVIACSERRLSATDVAGHDGVRPGAFVEISVSDTGLGMSEEIMARAFEPFFTTKPIGHGTGLGLSQIYGFVRQSGGFIAIESEVGRGTRVRLYLPRSDAAHLAPLATAAAEPARMAAGQVVLLVEDEEIVRAATSDHLRESGYRVIEMSTGAAALAALGGGAEVDALVTDVGLPDGMSGHQLADAVRERRPGIPVLFVTGYAGAALEAGLSPNMAVLTKPFALSELTASLAALLRTS